MYCKLTASDTIRNAELHKRRQSVIPLYVPQVYLIISSTQENVLSASASTHVSASKMCCGDTSLYIVREVEWSDQSHVNNKEESKRVSFLFTVPSRWSERNLKLVKPFNLLILMANASFFMFLGSFQAGLGQGCKRNAVSSFTHPREFWCFSKSPSLPKLKTLELLIHSPHPLPLAQDNGPH